MTFFSRLFRHNRDIRYLRFEFSITFYSLEPRKDYVCSRKMMPSYAPPPPSESESYYNYNKGAYFTLPPYFEGGGESKKETALFYFI